MGLAERDRDIPRHPHPSRLDRQRLDYDAIIERHQQAVEAGEPGYLDPASGLFVLTAAYLLARGTCCDSGCRHCPYLPLDDGRDAGGGGAGAMTAAQAIRNAHEWFEVNSGWAPPDPDTLDEWVADGVCRCPDECMVGPTEWCQHGLASWKLILDELD